MQLTLLEGRGWRSGRLPDWTARRSGLTHPAEEGASREPAPSPPLPLRTLDGILVTEAINIARLSPSPPLPQSPHTTTAQLPSSDGRCAQRPSLRRQPQSNNAQLTRTSRNLHQLASSPRPTIPSNPLQLRLAFSSEGTARPSQKSCRSSMIHQPSSHKPAHPPGPSAPRGTYRR